MVDKTNSATAVEETEITAPNYGDVGSIEDFLDVMEGDEVVDLQSAEDDPDDGESEESDDSVETDEESEEDSEEEETEEESVEDEAEEDSVEEETEEEESDDDKLLSGLDSKAKSKINKRFAELTSLHKSANEELAKEKEHNRILEDRLVALETTQGAASMSDAAKALQMHPLYLENDPALIDKRLEEIHQFEIFALDNDEGDVEIGETVYSQKDIRKHLADIRHEREAVLPRVRESMKLRSSAEDAAKKTYPEIFDRNTQEYRFYQEVIKTVPQLRKLPQISIMIGDMIRGARVRSESVKTGTTNKRNGSANNNKVRRPAPKLNTPKPKSASVREKAPRIKLNQERLDESGYDLDVVAEMLD